MYLKLRINKSLKLNVSKKKNNIQPNSAKNRVFIFLICFLDYTMIGYYNYTGLNDVESLGLAHKPEAARTYTVSDFDEII